MSEGGMYRANGHEFEVVAEFDGDQTVRCRNCLVREHIDADDDPNDHLELMTPECHIEWLREPDGGFHGVALRNAGYFSGRELIGVKDDDGDLEVADNVRVYDDDAPLLASLLDKSEWNNRSVQPGSEREDQP